MSATAMGRPLWVPFIAIVAAILVADQATKAWITSELSGGRSISFLGGALRLIYSENNGAVFGLFRGQVGLFALLSLGVIAVLVGLHARSGRNPYMTLTLGLLLGGAIGNAFDRIRLGYVVDFVDGGSGSLRFYTFNVGDACISLAIILLVILAIWPGLGAATAAPAAPARPREDEASSSAPALPVGPPPDQGPGNA